MKLILPLLLILTSCYSVLNYNKGYSHNEEKSNRERIVLKHDKFSKNQMFKERKNSRRSIKRVNIKSSSRRLIR